MRGSRLHRGTVALAVAWAAASAHRGLAATPLLSLAPGEDQRLRLEVERTGTNAVALWSSLAGKFTPEVAPPGHPTVAWQVQLPPGTPTGLAVLRLETGGPDPGTTRIVLVDSLRTSPQRPGEAQRDPAQAMVLRPPIAVEGLLPDTTPRHFRLDLAAGESVGLEVVARRLGYLLDPRLRVLDAGGRELARSEDSTTGGLDPALHFVAPHAGAYLIAIDDPRPHEAGGPQPFRLRVEPAAPGPLAWLPCAAPHPTRTPAVPVRTLSGPSADLRIDVRERPLRFAGIARPRGSRDVLHLTARAGEALRVDLWDRRLGSIGDFTAWIEDGGGRVLAEADGSRADVATFTHVFAHAGEHRLVVEPLAGDGGPGCDYELELGTGAGDFRVQLQEDTLSAAPGGTVELKFKVLRRGQDGPLKLSVHGLPDGVAVTGVEVAAKASEGTLRWQVPAAVPRDTLWELGVTGSGTTPGGTMAVAAETRVVQRKRWQALNEPPPCLDGRVWLRVR